MIRSMVNQWRHIVNVNLLAGIATVRWAHSRNSLNRGASETARSRLQELGGVLLKTHIVTVGMHGVGELIRSNPPRIMFSYVPNPDEL